VFVWVLESIAGKAVSRIDGAKLERIAVIRL